MPNPDECSWLTAILSTLGYIAFVIAITVFATRAWPILGPWFWSHF